MKVRAQGRRRPRPQASKALVSFTEMGDNLMDKVSAFGERLKISGAEVGRKMSSGMSSMSFKMKEFFQGDGPDWSTNLEICDMLNLEKISSVELIQAIKSRIMSKNPRVQYLALILLETCVKNCEKAFSEVAWIDDPQTVVNNRNKALVLIEAWGESASELQSLKSRGIRFPGRDDESLAPIFTPPRSVSEPEANFDGSQVQQAHPDVPVQSFSAENIKEAFDVARNSIELLSTVLSSSPQQEASQDELTTTLVQQCHQSQLTIQRIIQAAGDDEAVLFEALNLNDELQKTLSKYEQLKKPPVVQSEPEPAMIPVAVEPEDSPRISKEESLVRKPTGSRARSGEDDDMMNDLDEMIFGNKRGGTSEGRQQNKQNEKNDLIKF
ncbi:hypothetical protein J5N97_024976 [Dioscorea zingiberensis]|uniref:TOM1-like protein 2 n=1 Tax=Dioscorea zingiberensis TaxID=325984 RepID=A0A9D5H984_9LILI|nr:hypothetical protein J5N97_024976 [Dioscorea zingiberensis]